MERKDPMETPVDLIKQFGPSDELDSDALDAASMYMDSPAFEAIEKETYRFRMNELTEKIDGLTVKVETVQITVNPPPGYFPSYEGSPAMVIKLGGVNWAKDPLGLMPFTKWPLRHVGAAVRWLGGKVLNVGYSLCEKGKYWQDGNHLL